MLGIRLLLMTDEGLFLMFSTTELKGIFQYSAKLTAVLGSNEINFASSHLSESNILYIAFSVRSGVK